MQSRILSSKVLASEVTSIVEALRAFLHPPQGSGDIKETTEDFGASPSISKKRRTGTGREKDALSSTHNIVSSSGKWRDEEHEDKSGDEAVAEADDGWESGTVGAPSESDDPVAGAADDHDHDTSSEDSPDFASSSKRTPLHGSKGQSKFLPSLSVGFTPGDSDSEFSDSESKFIDGRKKNRRGQRARRA